MSDIRQRLKYRLACTLGTLVLALLGSGCARTEHVRRIQPAWQGDQGGGAELVFDGAAVTERSLVQGPSWSESRNDARLASRPTPGSFLAGTYPGDPRPSLDDLRVRYLRHHPDAVYYYSREPQRGRWTAPVYMYSE